MEIETKKKNIHHKMLIFFWPNKCKITKNYNSSWNHPNSSERVNWRLAIQDEINTMVEKNVFEIVDKKDKPSNQNQILTKWVFKRKTISNIGKDLLHLDFNRFKELTILTVTHLLSMISVQGWLWWWVWRTTWN